MVWQPGLGTGEAGGLPSHCCLAQPLPTSKASSSLQQRGQKLPPDFAFSFLNPTALGQRASLAQEGKLSWTACLDKPARGLLPLWKIDLGVSR